MPRRPVWVSGTRVRVAAAKSQRVTSLPTRLRSGTRCPSEVASKLRAPRTMRRAPGSSRRRSPTATTSSSACWPSASAQTTGEPGRVARTWARPALSAAPLPRFTGSVTTSAPAARTCAKRSAYAAPDPSSTTTTAQSGRAARRSATVCCIAGPGQKAGTSTVGCTRSALDVEDVGGATLAAVARPVADLAVEEERRGAAAVDVVGGDRSEALHQGGELGHRGAGAVAGGAAVDHHDEQVVVVDDADGGARLVALDEWLPKLVSTSTSSMPSRTALSATSAGPNDRVFHTPASTSVCASVAV